jgi:hypothetical protein
MCGIALLAIRVLLDAFDTYAHWEHLFAPGTVDVPDTVRRSILPVVAVYAPSILIGLVLPAITVALCCAIAVLLVVPFGALRRVFVRRT